MGLISKIILKFLRTTSINDFVKIKNSKIGNNFKLGDFCTVSLHETSQFLVHQNVNIRNYCNFFVGKNAKLIMQDHVFMNNFCSLNVLDYIEIGENTLLGEGVKLYDHNHEYAYDENKNLKIEHQKFKTAPIKIGKNCWLGSNVTVLKGVTIGDNCIIGAGSLIYKNVPSNTIIKAKQEYIVSSL